MKEPINYNIAAIACLLLGALLEGDIPVRESYCIYPTLGCLILGFYIFIKQEKNHHHERQN